MDKFVIKPCRHKIHLLLKIHLLIDTLEKIQGTFMARNQTMRQTKREALDSLLLSKEINKIYLDYLMFYDYADAEINICNIWDPLSPI